MRDREGIEKEIETPNGDFSNYSLSKGQKIIIELLLDIRDLLKSKE